MALGVAVKGAFEVSERDDEAGPAVPVAALHQKMLDEGPERVPKRAAISAVASVLPESITRISSAQSTLAIASAIFCASL